MEHIRLLMIDDKTFTTSLDRAGYREKGVLVYLAHDFKGALETIHTKPVDVVSINLDYNTDHSFETIKQLKNLEGFTFPVIATSIQSSRSLQKQAINNGADLFVEKPIPRDFFIEKIKQTLSHAVRDNMRIEAIGTATINDQPDVRIIDLSNTGLLVDYTPTLNENDQIKISLNLQDLGKSLKLEGIVIRQVNTDEKQGTGIRFLDIDKKNKAELEKYITSNKIDSYQLKYYL